jgi:hypothetical protein
MPCMHHSLRAARCIVCVLQAKSDFEHARLLHVISTRFAGVSNAAAAEAKAVVEALGPGVACFNPNTDNNKLAAGKDAEANAIWLRRWRDMLERTQQTGGCLLQILSVGEGLSHMQHAEADMAADKHVPVVVIEVGSADGIEVQLQRHGLEVARPHRDVEPIAPPLAACLLPGGVPSWGHDLATRAYFDAHRSALEAACADAVNAVVAAQPANPVRFLGEQLLQISMRLETDASIVLPGRTK